MHSPSTSHRAVPLRDIVAYVTGDGVNSLVINGMSFSMLYYTEALRLDYRLAALALAAGTFWNAVTEPVMGHITDNTRSRYGRRHPYMLLGGIFTVACFFLMWSVPQAFRAPHLLFWYLLGVNLLLRTGITTFSVPYGALGFEVCTNYTQRTTLQGLRVGFTMLINLAGPALAWSIFFKERSGVPGTSIAVNYQRMGNSFSIAALVFVVLVVWATRKYVIDTRHLAATGGLRPGDALKSIRDVIADRLPRPVFLFQGIVFIGMALVASLQMYVYVYFMEFSSLQKTIVHGATMVACGAGGVMSPLLVMKRDKKVAVYIAGLIAAGASLMLLTLFVPAITPTDASYHLPAAIPALSGRTLPVAMLVFLTFHSLYWLGHGVLTSIAGSMIADASELSGRRTGVLKDGSYSAMSSCITKLAIATGLLLSGYCLSWAGFAGNTTTQTMRAISGLVVATFLGGAIFPLAALLALRSYPVKRDDMSKLQGALDD